MCFNWKVLAGLAGLGLGIYVVAPELVLGVLPLLLLAACPLSMLFMSKSMMGGQGAQQGQQAPAAQDQRLPAATDAALTREEQLAQLRGQLAGLQAQQAALAAQIGTLARDEAREQSPRNGTPDGEPANGTVVAEAEAIARDRAARP